MSVSAPLRFLALAAGGWICLRAAMLLPGGWEKGALVATHHPARPVAARAPRDRLARSDRPDRARHIQLTAKRSLIRHVAYKRAPGTSLLAVGTRAPTAPSLWNGEGSATVADAAPSSEPVAAAPFAAAPARAGIPRRWSVSVWLLVRDERGTPALAPGGTLGGSQAGARLLYRLDERLALSGRAHVPLRRTRGAEIATGLDWRPLAPLPMHLLVERRQYLGGEGRSAFAITLYGGASRALPGGLRADLYGQAGVVGTRRRNPFADGVLKVATPLGPVELGGAAWGGAQPGAARLDAGPSLSWRLPIEGAELRLQADWRFRVAGEAAPGSGPALTLSTGF